MLMSGPPGYNTNSVNQQYNGLLGRPATGATPGVRPALTPPGMPGLSTNPLANGSAAQRMQMLVKLLQGGKS